MFFPLPIVEGIERESHFISSELFRTKRRRTRRKRKQEKRGDIPCETRHVVLSSQFLIVVVSSYPFRRDESCDDSRGITRIRWKEKEGCPVVRKHLSCY